MRSVFQKLFVKPILSGRQLYIKVVPLYLLNIEVLYNLKFRRRCHCQWNRKLLPNSVHFKQSFLHEPTTMAASNNSVSITVSHSGADGRTVTYDVNCGQNRGGSTWRGGRAGQHQNRSGHYTAPGYNFSEAEHQGSGRGRNGSRGDGGRFQRRGSGRGGQGGWERNDADYYQHSSQWNHRGGSYSYGQGQQDYDGGGYRGNRSAPYPQAGGASNRHVYNNEENLVFLSKSLSSILRHNAGKFGLELMTGGFLYVEDLLRLPRFKNFRTADVRKVVEDNDKQRFALEVDPTNQKLKIRANQGHSVKVEGLALTPITLENADDYPNVIHGTYFENWKSIKTQGLRRMNRTHIHFAPGEPKQGGVVSGMRQSCEIMIYLDLKRALKDGLKFFVSENNVILSEGDKDGCIYPYYFDGVHQRYPRQRIPFDNTIKSKEMTADEVASESEGKKKKKKNKNKMKGSKDNKPEDVATEQKVSSDKGDNPKNEKEDAGDGKSSEMVTDWEENWDDDIEKAVVEQNKDVDKTCEKKEDKTKTGDGQQETVNEESMEVIDDQKPDPVKVGVSEQTKTLKEKENADEKTLKDEKNTGAPIFNHIDNIEKCAEAVKALMEMSDSKKSIAVLCVCEGGSSDKLQLLCISDTFFNIYNFDIFTCQEMMKSEGPLFELLQDSQITRVFHNRVGTWKILNDEYKVCPDSMPLFDIQIVYESIAQAKAMNPGCSADLTAIAEQLGVSVSAPEDGTDRMDDTDWSVRPLTEGMKQEITTTLKTLMDVYSKLDEIKGDWRKDKPMFYKKIKEEIDTKESHELFQKRKEAKKEANKKDPNAQSSSTAKKGKKKKGKR